MDDSPRCRRTPDPRAKHLHLNLEPPKGQGQLHDALSMKLGTRTFKIVRGSVKLAVHTMKTVVFVQNTNSYLFP
jgi:hypothetical protein